jgi:hypothetical protein
VQRVAIIKEMLRVTNKNDLLSKHFWANELERMNKKQNTCAVMMKALVDPELHRIVVNNLFETSDITLKVNYRFKI